MSDLVTVADVERYINVQNVNAVLLARLVTSASEFIEAYLSRRILLSTFTDVRDGNGHDQLMMINIPVVSVLSVLVGSVQIPEAPAPEPGGAINPPGYSWDDMSVYLGGGAVFAKGRRNVVITYESGFSVVPAAIQQATIDLVVRKYGERTREGVDTKTVAGEAITYSQKDMSDNTKTLLAPYNTVAPVLR